ncbi:MAG: hypothetical protein P4L43_01695 [Syntrophobacteraceae bacterium]|nr:hypothetical protein [Syntrophobacteraceae bacterium]
MSRMEPNLKIDDLRSDILKAENRIVEDIEHLKEMLHPGRVVSELMSAVKEELSMRLQAVEGQKLETIGNRVISEVKGRPFLFGLLGLGITGLIFYGLTPEKESRGGEDRVEKTGEELSGFDTERDYPLTGFSPESETSSTTPTQFCEP